MYLFVYVTTYYRWARLVVRAVKVVKVLGLKLNVHSLHAASQSKVAYPAFVSAGALSGFIWIHIAQGFKPDRRLNIEPEVVSANTRSIPYGVRQGMAGFPFTGLPVFSRIKPSQTCLIQRTLCFFMTHTCTIYF